MADIPREIHEALVESILRHLDGSSPLEGVEVYDVHRSSAIDLIASGTYTDGASTWAWTIAEGPSAAAIQWERDAEPASVHPPDLGRMVIAPHMQHDAGAWLVASVAEEDGRHPVARALADASYDRFFAPGGPRAGGAAAEFGRVPLADLRWPLCALYGRKAAAARDLIARWPMVIRMTPEAVRAEALDRVAKARIALLEAEIEARNVTAPPALPERAGVDDAFAWATAWARVATRLDRPTTARAALRHAEDTMRLVEAVTRD